MLLVKALNNEQVSAVYNEHMVFDFPDNELKPLWAIETLSESGLYHAYGLYNHDTLCGYAFFATSGSENEVQKSLLLDYFAVISGGRSRGFGSRFLKLLQPLLQKDFPMCQGIIAEVESVRAAPDPDEKQLRERRIAFYRRNDFRRTRIRSKLFGVAFTIMFQPFTSDAAAADDGFALEQMNIIYATMLPANIREQNVQMWLKPPSKQSTLA